LGALAPSDAAKDEKDPWKLLARGQVEEARRRFSEVDARESKYGLARVASLCGDHAGALRLSLPLTQADGPCRHEAKVQAGRALVRLGRFNEAVLLLREAAAEPGGSRSAEAGYDLGSLLYRAGEAEKARAVWREVTRQHAGSPSAVRAEARLAWPEALA